MNYLIVAAHPDDEVLGAGATIVKLLRQGHKVSLCVLSSKCRTRYDMATDALLTDMHRSHALLGLKDVYTGNYSCLCFKDEPHEEMVKFIELAMKDSASEVIFTHHPNDLNNDHYITSIVCQEAARLHQRQLQQVPPLRNLLFMEVPSSTDWALNPSWGAFSPNTFVEVDEDGLRLKLDALGVYNNVIRDAPHPRSDAALHALATYRGSQSGYRYAEAFQSVMRLEV